MKLKNNAESFDGYGVDKVENLPINYAGLVLQAGEEYSNLVYDRHFGALWDIYERQQQLQQISSVFAPFLAIRSLSMAMAGTDFSLSETFLLPPKIIAV